ncbi:MAG: hypothetical protein H7641_02895 [Candidatus Heimdallarchaeota archaeon]|nr:hypothetical protein [Candidatus Heimdallarchaeota archaeon]
MINYANESTKINYKTNLYFETDDLSDNTILLVKYTWDRLGGFWYTSAENDFSLNVLPIYNHDSIAEFYVFVEDIVGNNFTYTFSFIIDIEAPLIDLRIFDAAENEWVDISDITHIQRNVEIVYNDSVNDDLALFEYAWNWTGSDEDLIVLDESASWTILAPIVDGSYDLTVILTDNTNSYPPNVNNQTFYFLIDKIVLNFSIPGDFSSTPQAFVNSTDLIYGDSVSYELTVTDAVGLEIEGLQNNIVKDEILNISVELNKLDSTTYEIFIIATNVTDGIPTKIQIQFFKYDESKQLIWIYLDIFKKEGSLTIDSIRSNDNVTFEEDITIVVNLDNNLGENETINYIEINGLIVILDFTALPDGFL